MGIEFCVYHNQPPLLYHYICIEAQHTHTITIWSGKNKMQFVNNTKKRGRKEKKRLFCWFRFKHLLEAAKLTNTHTHPSHPSNQQFNRKKKNTNRQRQLKLIINSTTSQESSQFDSVVVVRFVVARSVQFSKGNKIIINQFTFFIYCPVYGVVNLRLFCILTFVEF